MRSAIALCLCFALAGCGGMTPRQAAAVTLNTSAAFANASADGVLAAMCLDELRALHHTGQFEAGHCVRTDAQRVATPAELAELAAVRDKWHAVRDAYETFAAAHDTARTAADGDLVGALSHLAATYDHLRVEAAALGVKLPALMSE